MEQRRFWHRPDWRFVLRFLLLAAGAGAWWVLVYVGIDWLTGLRTHRVRIHMDWELAIPFWPSWSAVYVSMNLLFPMLPLVLRRREELRGLLVAWVLAVGLAGVGFLLFPAEPAYAVQSVDGHWAKPLYLWARAAALNHNMAPSLHVALTVLCVWALARHAGPLGKTLLWLWAAAVAASTLLTHQHHVVDMVTGFALGFGVAAGVQGSGFGVQGSGQATEP